jgi:hypothetical protein
MRRSLTVIATILLAELVLAGCSGSAPTADDKRYADAVAAADPDDFGGIPTDELADTLGSEGTDLCDQLKKGTVDDAAAYAETGFSKKESNALIAAAVLVYCPSEKGKISAH